MIDQTDTQAVAKAEKGPFLRLALEAGPLLIFFVANQVVGAMPAIAVFMAALVVAVALSVRLERRWPIMPMVSCVFVLIFGGLTLWLNDDLFFKLKPTVVNLLFAAILFAGLATGRNFLKLMMGTVFELTEQGWRILTWRWAVFFVVLAVINEIVWRNFSFSFWAGFKLFGILPLTLVFAMAQMPVLMRHQVKPAE
ncbi:intracellular septation protein [Inquilinus ginsengisoli]|jgi:intracellular septation protein|uniref:septation protein A n=1 Tax=Inquilinus ginsengisoli TaxID=363840 RepID=UPI003D21B04A